MKAPAHPVSEVAAAFYHGCIAGFLFLGLAFHVYAALAHWRDRRNEPDLRRLADRLRAFEKGDARQPLDY